MSQAYKQIENSFTEATAREHIARYNALQKQLEIERKDAELSRKDIISTALAIGFIALCGVFCTISANCVTRTMSSSARFERIPNCVMSYAMRGDGKA